MRSPVAEMRVAPEKIGRPPVAASLIRPSRPSLRAAAVLLVLLGVATCLVPFALVGYGMWQEQQLTQNWATTLRVGDSPAPASSAVVQAPPPPSTPQAAFAIRVPKIGYYAAVQEGVSPNLLATGPGHYPNTAMPGSPGLVGIAAHNTFWIPFGRLGPGDVITLETQHGNFDYHVTGTRIVQPDDRSVLARVAGYRLALTTCWPLWAGNLARQRLVMFASLAQ